ncbi:hypothetical protein NLJ89_g2296 [Agrocybe chaxingu]|uniref:Replication factor-A protein 1 N-terminal domain-containing protein n=1 Tax=Agrocybe chaxingu TaxID=84603 RepID=A0A9W8MYX0_9AGAR|nr:hypothetical protein NLJ89_g2296 [Agrocybe chaxingu]
MTYQLSAGSCRLFQTCTPEDVDVFNTEHTVQFLSIKKVGNTNSGPDRYRIIMSDGVHYMQAMLATQLNQLVQDNVITKCTVATIEKLTCNYVQDKRLIIILITGDRDFAYALSILRLRCYRIVLLTLANAHPSLTMQASVCYDWVNEVVDVVDSPKSQPGITGRAGQGVNDPRNESLADSVSSVASTIRRSPQLEDGIKNEEPIDITNYLSGRTHLRQPSQSSSTSTYNPQLVPLERSREGASTASHVSSCSMHSPPATIRNTSALLPFPSTLCTPPQSTSRGSLMASAPKSLLAPSAVANTTYVWTTSQDISIPAQPNVQSTLSLADRDRSSVLLDRDIVIEGGLAPRPPSPRPASAPSLLSSPTPFLLQPPQPMLKPPSIALPLPSQPPQSPQAPQPCTPSATVSVAATIKTTPQIVTISTNISTPSTSLPKPTTVASAVEDPPLSSPIFAVLVDALQNHRLKGTLRPLRSTIAIQIAKDGVTYRNAGVDRFSQYAALALKRGIIELGGSEGTAWISLRPGWGKANLS